MVKSKKTTQSRPGKRRILMDKNIWQYTQIGTLCSSVVLGNQTTDTHLTYCLHVTGSDLLDFPPCTNRLLLLHVGNKYITKHMSSDSSLQSVNYMAPLTLNLAQRPPDHNKFGTIDFKHVCP